MRDLRPEFVNGFELRSMPDGYVDCVAWNGAVISTHDDTAAATSWAKENDAPQLCCDARNEINRLTVGAFA